MKLRIGLLAALVAMVALVATAFAARPHGKVPNNAPSTTGSAQLRAAVKTKGVFRHLEKLQKFADKNGGTRAAGTPGFQVSTNYVARKLKSYGWQVTRQNFAFDQFFEDAPSVFEQTAPTATTYVEDTDYSTMEFSGSGEVTAGLVAVDLTLPPSPEPGSSSGCEASDFDGLAIAGQIALMQRGTCDFAVKVQNAADAGAAGSIIFNEGQEGRTDVVFGTLGTPAEIPAVDTSFELGNEFANGTANGPTGTSAHIETTTHSENLTAQNVVAETKKGDPDNVVMAGAHLDSVTEGPGIQDNGTGSAALLEMAHQIDKLGVKPKNKLRFAWWGAEEEGLIGSTEYVAGLSEAEGAQIALYLNFDMIGSPNYARYIYDGNGSKFGDAGPAGSDAIERTFQRYFDRVDLATGQTAFDGRSDYGPFIDVGIPAGGLFTGAEEVKTDAEAALFGGTAGEEFDPCYHQACDDIDNVNRKALGQMSDAAAHAVSHYSRSLRFIPRPQPTPERAKNRKQKRPSKYLGDALRR